MLPQLHEMIEELKARVIWHFFPSHRMYDTVARESYCASCTYRWAGRCLIDTLTLSYKLDLRNQKCPLNKWHQIRETNGNRAKDLGNICNCSANTTRPRDRELKALRARVLLNPCPCSYTVLEKIIGKASVYARIKYHGCSNYEGEKILIFATPDAVHPERQEPIDPHFSDDSEHPTPFARFEPTELGRAYALALCDLLDKQTVEQDRRD